MDTPEVQAAELIEMYEIAQERAENDDALTRIREIIKEFLEFQVERYRDAVRDEEWFKLLRRSLDKNGFYKYSTGVHQQKDQ